METTWSIEYDHGRTLNVQNINDDGHDDEEFSEPMSPEKVRVLQSLFKRASHTIHRDTHTHTQSERD